MSSAPQTSVSLDPVVGLPGAPGDDFAARFNRDSTYISEEASAGLPFGYLLKRGTANLGGTGVHGALLPTAKTDKPAGFVKWAIGYSRPSGLDTDGVQPKTHLALTEKGEVWVMPEEDMVPGDDVHWRVTTNSGKFAGQIGTTDDGVRTIDISPFCQVLQGGGPTSGQPAKVSFDFTNAALATTDS